MSSEGLYEYNDDGDYLLKIQKCRQHEEDSAYAGNVEVSIDGRTCCLPPSQRTAAAAALIGNDYTIISDADYIALARERDHLKAAQPDRPEPVAPALREQLAQALIEHTRVSAESCRCGWGSNAGNLGQSHALHVTGVALLPLIREHVAAAVQTERERLAHGGNLVPHRLAADREEAMDQLDEVHRRAEKAEAAIERVRASPAEHPSGGYHVVSMRDVLAALDGTEATDG